VPRDYLSIGEVLVSLKPEFPDVTISKIRFLETEGLIGPGRTASGYRKFYGQDVERLREVLRLQRDEYLPLRVIKDRLERDEPPEGEGSSPRPAREAAEEPDEDLTLPATELQMTAQELATATGLETELIEALESFGLIHSRAVDGTKYYAGDDLIVSRIIKEFFKYGIEPRHLTMYRHFAEREAGFFETIVLPVLRQRNPDARREATASLAELARISRQLKQALLRAHLRAYLAGS
jgi:DNA-binding transcriptional MerR regulator